MGNRNGSGAAAALLVLWSWMSAGRALGDTLEETYVATMEMEYATAYSGQRSCVVTYNDNIYFAFVDDSYRTVIAKKTPDGTVTETVIFQETMDDGHNGPSVGIDRDGYIHVVANMHHSPYNFPDNGNPYYEYAWQYMVSDSPEDISSFTFVGSDPQRTIPGTSITYPFFARDNNGVLFVSFRIRVRTGGWEPGDLGAAIARYDADSRSWTMLGGSDYLHGTKIFFWNNSGVDGAYQPYGPHLRFDRNNRLHISWVADDGTGRSGGHFTHVLYAFTDDGGETFQRADGSLHDTLPITLATGDIVAGPEFGASVDGFSFRSCVDVTADGRPVVVIPTERTSGECNYLSLFEPGSGWSQPQAYPSSYRGRLVIDSNGIMTSVGIDNGRPGLSRSFDDGQTWQTYPGIEAQGHSVRYDYPYMDQTNQIRYQDRTGSTGLARVWTIAFSGTTPPVQREESCTDEDGDGYGDPADNCQHTEGDCDDAEGSVHPGALEACNGTDDDCDGETDETFELDSDTDNCGFCGNACAEGQFCSHGQCQSDAGSADAGTSGGASGHSGTTGEGRAGSGGTGAIAGAFDKGTAGAAGTETAAGPDGNERDAFESGDEGGGCRCTVPGRGAGDNPFGVLLGCLWFVFAIRSKARGDTQPRLRRQTGLFHRWR